MDAENSKARLKQQIESLRSSNRTAILSTLKDLRSDGDVSVLSELFQLLLVQEDREIQDEIAALLNDLKDQEEEPGLGNGGLGTRNTRRSNQSWLQPAGKTDCLMESISVLLWRCLFRANMLLP